MKSGGIIFQGLTIHSQIIKEYCELPDKGVFTICTTSILFLKITTFCPNMMKITAADQMVGGCAYLFDKLELVKYFLLDAVQYILLYR